MTGQLDSFGVTLVEYLCPHTVIIESTDLKVRKKRIHLCR